MRKYNLKRNKAYYEGKVIGIDVCICELNEIIINNLYRADNTRLYILKDKLENLRSEAVKNYKEIKV